MKDTKIIHTEIEGIIYSTEANGIEIIRSDSDSMTYALADKTVKIVWGYAGAGESGPHTSYDAFAEAERSDGECLYYRTAGELNDDHFYTWCDAAAYSLLTGETDLLTVTEGGVQRGK